MHLRVPRPWRRLKKGGAWLDSLRGYVYENRRIAEDFIRDEIPNLHAVQADATYLMWIDVSGLCPDGTVFTAHLRKKTGLVVTEGEEYGECGKAFIRFNLAAPRSVLFDGLNRLKAGADSFG